MYWVFAAKMEKVKNMTSISNQLYSSDSTNKVFPNWFFLNLQNPKMVWLPGVLPSGRVGGGGEKHEMYADTLSGHPFYDLFLQGWGGGWVVGPRHPRRSATAIW